MTSDVTEDLYYFLKKETNLFFQFQIRRATIAFLVIAARDNPERTEH